MCKPILKINVVYFDENSQTKLTHILPNRYLYKKTIFLKHRFFVFINSLNHDFYSLRRRSCVTILEL